MESIRLIGTEDVQRAGYNMQGAAEDMLRASQNIDGAAARIEHALSIFSSNIVSLEQALKQHADAMNYAAGRLPPGNFGPL